MNPPNPIAKSTCRYIRKAFCLISSPIIVSPLNSDMCGCHWSSHQNFFHFVHLLPHRLNAASGPPRSITVPLRDSSCASFFPLTQEYAGIYTKLSRWLELSLCRLTRHSRTKRNVNWGQRLIQWQKVSLWGIGSAKSVSSVFTDSSPSYVIKKDRSHAIPVYITDQCP